jgi:UDP-N-acetylglucosamine--N-acetylmuramyl-(pentapeptide) pyrophosphoryl-undecaprenol N-acetylglucosamine transferase
MTHDGPTSPRITIACGGTGGHLFPGVAVADQLVQRGCRVTLMVSPKEVDQQAVKMADAMEVITLPAVGLQRGHELAFVRGFWRSYRTAKKHFKAAPPHAALAMGGFTSAPPLLAAKTSGAQTFLHESNTIPGRANRWLSRVVDRAFIGFPSTRDRLSNRQIILTGTPVRSQFRLREAAACREAIGLDPARAVLVVMGGSQGASGINTIVIRALPVFAKLAPELQWFHLSGPGDAEKLRQAYAASKLRAVVHPFFTSMELALGAATVAVSRAGASSLAELAAMRVPAVLVPYPAAMDNHQFHNARSFVETGAAYLLEEKNATPESLANLILDLVNNAAAREKIRNALAQWHAPQAAEQIAEAMLQTLGRESKTTVQPGAGQVCAFGPVIA